MQCFIFRSSFTVHLDFNTYDRRYYLADDIYPAWCTFMHTFTDSATDMRSYFAQCQDTCRKDVEHAFSVLQQCLPLFSTLLSYLARVSYVRGDELLFDHVKHDHRE
jgi:hypothetical protein